LQPRRWEAWSLDRLYDRWIVGPYVKAAQANRADVVNGFYDAAAEAVVRVHLRLSGLQTGAVRWYAAVFVGSAALFIWFMIT
jgi:hypothetical protein